MANIDVIIPLYNKAKFVEQAIRSALNQTLPPRRVIVADDGSSDGSAEIVSQIQEQRSDVLLLRNGSKTPLGAAGSRNRAIHESESDFIAFLDADDWWEPSKLQRQMDLFGDGRVGLVHCGCNYYSAIGDKHLFVLTPDPIPAPEHLYDKVRLGTYWVTGSASAVVVRRSIWNKTNGFPNRSSGEDWRAWVSCAALAHFGAVQAALCNYRFSPKATSRTDTFISWLASMEEWADDSRFLSLATQRARILAIGPQLDALRSPAGTDALLDRIATEGGPLRDLFPTRASYYFNLLHIPKRGSELLVSRLRRIIPRFAISAGKHATEK